MDRREFFKTMLTTPLLAPLLLASIPAKSDCELYLIADDPHLFIPLVLKELEKFKQTYGRNFILLNSHPQENNIRRTLIQEGWRCVQKPIQADLILSFTPLGNAAFPSFTLVKDGKIWDIRSRKLYSLWREMNKNYSPSLCLTIASLKNRRSDLLSGELVTLYKDGNLIERISLKKKLSKSFRTQEGKITARVEDGKAWISESSCRHKICLHTPPVSLAGERIICAPSHFLLEIQGQHSVDTSIG